MSATTISTIPEELRQEITSYLNYDDAWSLKQTSALFYHVLEIPTIQSFLACPYGPSLAMLEEWEIIPLGHEACHYCRRLLPKECFSRFQRHLTAARQHSLSFDYTSWNPKKHYCLDCGVREHYYPAGRRVYIGFGDPGSKNEAVMPCKQCGTLVDYHSRDFRLCPKCNGRIRADELECRWNDEVTEPESNAYENVGPGSLLVMGGERLLSQTSETEDQDYQI